MNILIILSTLAIICYVINQNLQNERNRLELISDLTLKLEDLEEENRKLKAELTAQKVFYTKEG
jgi:cell shape-determining protein MreC